MKRLLQLLCIVVASAGCAHTMSAKEQKVRARKKDLNDKRKVTVTITAGNGVLKKESTFVKNTDGPLTKKLYFDFSQGTNTITASYQDDPTDKFGLVVPSADDAPEGSEILIDGKMIKIIPPKTKPIAEKIEAAVIVPINSGTWTLASGTKDLTASMIGRHHPAVLQEITCVRSKSAEQRQNVCKLFIYKEQTTKIYTKKEGSQGKITSLTTAVIKKLYFVIQRQGVRS